MKGPAVPVGSNAGGRGDAADVRARGPSGCAPALDSAGVSSSEPQALDVRRSYAQGVDELTADAAAADS